MGFILPRGDGHDKSNTNEAPISKEMAGVNICLKPGGIRVA
ncbi:MAG: hypothetical protein WA364_03760 [Candidatus Nitrosopolaris sp.]